MTFSPGQGKKEIRKFAAAENGFQNFGIAWNASHSAAKINGIAFGRTTPLRHSARLESLAPRKALPKT